MQHLKKSFIMLLAGIAITIGSCKKDTINPSEEESTPTPSGFNNANAKALFNNLATPLHSFTINASSYHTYVCANGTKISISPNAFLTQSGAAVTGVVQIEVKDVLSKKDMILNNAIPVSNGRLLVSGGEVYFNATQGGQQLKVNPASTLYYQVPSANPSYQMREFYASAGSNLSNTNLNWTTDTSSAFTNTIAVVQDTSSGSGNNYYYYFQSDSLNWSNCDYFYSNPGAKTTCTVSLTGSADNSNSAVFLSMNGANVLVRLNATSYSSITQQFESYLNSIPEGVNYTVVVVSFDGTNYYYGSKAVTMTTNMVISMPVLSQTTKSQIELNLSTLP
jgi:hypothetical protein